MSSPEAHSGSRWRLIGEDGEVIAIAATLLRRVAIEELPALFGRGGTVTIFPDELEARLSWDGIAEWEEILPTEQPKTSPPIRLRPPGFPD
ncbi:MAG: hypothetical protein GY871_04605 [Actinomycetales bacterium]|nr:hypothetical protein [Actinomycetales bacterium]